MGGNTCVRNNNDKQEEVKRGLKSAVFVDLSATEKDIFLQKIGLYHVKHKKRFLKRVHDGSASVNGTSSIHKECVTRNLLLDVDLTSHLGKSLLKSRTCDLSSPAITSLIERNEKFIDGNCGEKVRALRERSFTRFPITYSISKVRAGGCHKYCFNRKQQEERHIVLRTGLCKTARYLQSQCKPCTVALTRLTPEDLQRWKCRKENAKPFVDQKPPPLPPIPIIKVAKSNHKKFSLYSPVTSPEKPVNSVIVKGKREYMGKEIVIDGSVVIDLCSDDEDDVIVSPKKPFSSAVSSPKRLWSPNRTNDVEQRYFEPTLPAESIEQELETEGSGLRSNNHDGSQLPDLVSIDYGDSKYNIIRYSTDEDVVSCASDKAPSLSSYSTKSVASEKSSSGLVQRASCRLLLKRTAGNMNNENVSNSSSLSSQEFDPISGMPKLSSLDCLESETENLPPEASRPSTPPSLTPEVNSKKIEIESDCFIQKLRNNFPSEHLFGDAIKTRFKISLSPNHLAQHYIMQSLRSPSPVVLDPSLGKPSSSSPHLQKVNDNRHVVENNVNLDMVNSDKASSVVEISSTSSSSSSPSSVNHDPIQTVTELRGLSNSSTSSGRSKKRGKGRWPSNDGSHRALRSSPMKSDANTAPLTNGGGLTHTLTRTLTREPADGKDSSNGRSVWKISTRCNGEQLQQKQQQPCSSSSNKRKRNRLHLDVIPGRLVGFNCNLCGFTELLEQNEYDNFINDHVKNVHGGFDSITLLRRYVKNGPSNVVFEAFLTKNLSNTRPPSCRRNL